MQLTLLYFAALREQAGKEQETLSSNAATVAQLYAELTEHYSFTLPPQRLRAAVNHQLCDWNQTLNEGDTVAFIPPVSGG